MVWSRLPPVHQPAEQCVEQDRDQDRQGQRTQVVRGMAPQVGPGVTGLFRIRWMQLADDHEDDSREQDHEDYPMEEVQLGAEMSHQRRDLWADLLVQVLLLAAIMAALRGG